MGSSTFSRILSGSLASWSQIFVNLIAQLVITPVFLSYWSAKTYGIWLTFLAATSFLQIIDNGHQTYLGNKFLIIGRDNKRDIEKTLSSALPLSIFSALFQIFVTIMVLNFTPISNILGHTKDPSEIYALKFLLIGQVIIWGSSGSLGGLFVRSLSPFGHYSRFAWWQTILQSVMLIAPVVAVISGGGLLEAGITMLGATFFINIGLLLNVKLLYNKEEITIVKPTWSLGLYNFRQSLMLTLKAVLEMFRQQGARLILSPLGGAKEMAAFATMRTGANVASQGLSSITNPLMPELMRFLTQKDQARSEAAFGTVWIVMVAIMAPTVVILQCVVGPLYVIWTRGQIPFNPLLFAVLSLSILVYAGEQPSVAVVTGNNLLKSLLSISAIAATIVVGGMFILVPRIGILGAGIALLVAEIAATTFSRMVAKRWLHQNGLVWPKTAYSIANTSVWIAAFSMLLMVYFANYKWIILPVALILLFWNLRRYWKVLPTLVTQRVSNILKISRLK